MKKHPIHQNLSTSFVNVAALVHHLRNLQFVGSIRLELINYEADIIFTSSKTIRAREYDHVAGRIVQDQGALGRILARSKEPHGRIHVYESVDGYAGTGDSSVFIDKSIMARAREMAASAGGTAAKEKGFEIVMSSRDGKNALVLAALSEILKTIDETLAKGNLSFASAFQLACDSIAPAYAFMERNRHAMIYAKGEIRLNVPAEASSVASAVFDALKPIFRRLRRERKYESLYLSLSKKLIEGSAERRSEYMRLGLMRHIDDLLAVE